MFRRSGGKTAGPTVRIEIDGRTVSASPGDSVAAALLAAGIATTRHSPVGGRARGPFCMIGACFECLVTIDGAIDRQACLVPVSEGMRVSTRSGARPWPEADTTAAGETAS